VSVEAISWALNLAPVPRDRGGQPSSPCKFVLVGLANHAGPDGTGAFPSVATLVRYTGLSERAVRTCLDRLAADGTIAPCDPAIVAARMKRADRRPQGWDLDNWPDGVQRLHPTAGTGCNVRTSGVQRTQPRGAPLAPEPYEEPCIEPSAARARARKALPGADDGLGGVPVSEFFDALGTAWRLTAAQRERLAPAVDAALSAGWTPAGLAEITGANTDGVRNRYAVLAARLSAAELPGPPRSASRPLRPPWCGACDQRTRRREDADGADAGRCRLCHPLASTAPPAAGDGPDVGCPGLIGAGRAAGRHDAVSACAYEGTRTGMGEGMSFRG
jgi:Helix-turn-helix domain